MTDAPKRAVQFRLEVGADNTTALADVLFNLAQRIDRAELSAHAVSGGHDSEHVHWLTVSDVPSHDEYVAQLNAWLARNKVA